MVRKQRYAVLYGEFVNEKKEDNFFLTFQSGDFELKIFSNFLALDLNLRVTRSNLGNLLKEIGLYFTHSVSDLNVKEDNICIQQYSTF